MTKKNQKGAGALGPVMSIAGIFTIGFLIAIILLIFSSVQSLASSSIGQFLTGGDASGASYQNGVPTINANVKVTQCTALPIDPNKVTSYNGTLHGSSVFDHTFIGGHNTFMGWNCKAKGTQCGDAVDLNTQAGTPVYAPFAGSCSRDSNGTALENAVIVSSDGKMKSTLAHINVTCGGSKVEAAQQVGTVSSLLKTPHLHFELWIDGSPIASPHPGKSLWDLMQKILTQQPCK